MPRYKIQTDEGDTLVLEGDSEPTADELEEIFKSRAPQAQPAQPPAAAPLESPSWLTLPQSPAEFGSPAYGGQVQAIAGNPLVLPTAADLGQNPVLELPEDNGKGRLRSAGASFMQGGGVGVGTAMSGAVRLLDAGAASALEEAAASTGNRELFTMAEQVRNRTPEQKEADIARDDIYKAGRELTAGAKEAFVPNPKFRGEFWTDTMPSAGGQMVPTVAAGIINPALAAAQYGLSSGQQGAEESIAKGDIADVDKVFFAYLGLGALSEFALGVPANILRYAQAARKAGVGKETAKAAILKAVGKGGAKESAQESLEQVGQNIIAQQTFDPKRKTLEGVPESLAAGFLLGGAGAGVAAGVGALEQPTTTKAPTQPPNAPQRTLEAEQTPVRRGAVEDYTGEPGEVVVTAEELKAPAKAEITPAQEQAIAARGGMESLPYEASDLTRYNELKSEQGKLQSEGKIISPETGEFTAEWSGNWKEFEALRNKYNGMPPKQVATASNANAQPKEAVAGTGEQPMPAIAIADLLQQRQKAIDALPPETTKQEAWLEGDPFLEGQSKFSQSGIDAVTKLNGEIAERIADAASRKEPLPASIEAGQFAIPDGYVREGNQYVYKPKSAATPAPENKGGGQGEVFGGGEVMSQSEWNETSGKRIRSRPTGIKLDKRGRPTDPERSRAAIARHDKPIHEANTKAYNDYVEQALKEGKPIRNEWLRAWANNVGDRAIPMLEKYGYDVTQKPFKGPTESDTILTPKPPQPTAQPPASAGEDKVKALGDVAAAKNWNVGYSIAMPEVEAHFYFANKESALKQLEGIREGEEIQTLGDMFRDLVKKQGDKLKHLGQQGFRAYYKLPSELEQAQPKKLDLKNPRVILEPYGYTLDEADLMAYIKQAIVDGEDSLVIVALEALPKSVKDKLDSIYNNPRYGTDEKLDTQVEALIDDNVLKVDWDNSQHLLVTFSRSHEAIPENLAEIKTMSRDEALDLFNSGKISKKQLKEFLTEPSDWTSATEDVAEPAAPEPGKAEPPSDPNIIEMGAGIPIPKFANRKMSPLDRVTTSHSSKLQKSFSEARTAQNEIKQAVPSERRQSAISVWREANGDIPTLQTWAAAAKGKVFKQAAIDAQSLTPKEIAIANKAIAAFTALETRGNTFDVLGSHRENYVPHVWDVKRPGSGFGTGMLRQKFRFAKARTFDTFFDGDQAGFKPKTLAIGKLLPAYIHEMNRVIADRQAVRDLAKGTMPDGSPMVVPKGNVKVVDGASGKAVLVSPKAARVADTSDYKVMADQPALSNWIWQGKDTDGKPVFVSADLAVHPDVFRRLTAILGQSAIRTWYHDPVTGPAQIPRAIVRGLDTAQSAMKREMFGLLAPFHQVQEGTHAIGHLVNPFFGLEKVDLVKNPKMVDAANHGLMLLPDRASSRVYIEGVGTKSSLLSQGLRKTGKFTGGIGEAIADVIDGYQDYLFHQYIPALKYKTYEAMLGRNTKLYAKELASGEMTEADVKLTSAEQANAAYGHLNYALLDRNPTIQHMIQLAALAPDFLEARARFAGQGVKGLRSKVGHEQMKAIAILAAAQAGMAYVLSQLLGVPYDEEHPFEVVYGGRRYAMRSVPEDIFAMLKDQRRFIYSRVNPLTVKGTIQLATGLNYRGEKTTPTETMTELLAGYIPITARSIPALRSLTETGRKTSVTPLQELAGSLGLRISRYSPISETYQLAGEWMEKQKLPKDRGSYPVSKYQQLRYALEDGDMDKAKAEYEALKKDSNSTKVRDGFRLSISHPFTGSEANDRKFSKSLTGYDKELYEQAIRTRKNILRAFNSL